jgi:predicted O-linked N-acetylglucosamine transferase (SPINDLY family)
LFYEMLFMNAQSLAKTPGQGQEQAYQCLLQGNYDRAVNCYEQAIAAEPDVKSHYWYLGLVLSLQGQQAEAQATWLMGMLEGEPSEVEQWTGELREVLHHEATRRETQEDKVVAWQIRHHIREICPSDINNLLQLIQLAIALGTYTGDELIEFKVIELLKSEPPVEVDLELLMTVLPSVLEKAPLHPSSLELAEAGIPYVREANQALAYVSILLPAAIAIGYTKKHPAIAARLIELGLRLDEHNPEFLYHLAGFYLNAGQYEKGIETAKLSYSLTQNLPERVIANNQMLKGLTSAGGTYWEEALSSFQRQESLLLSLIEEHPTQLTPIEVARIINSNYYTPYFQDRPKAFRKIRNQIAQLCQDNVQIYAKELVERYKEGHLQRKKQSSLSKVLKIGYLSHCFKTHSVGWLARWIFQHHNRDRFQVHGYFLCCDPIYDPLHDWYLNQIPHTYKSDDSASMAEQIYQDEIDILIDLDSLTLDVTCAVLALKPAPVQVTWLGWDASGIPTIDYYIADPYALPESAQEDYQEKIWRLPQTYIAVDGFEVGVPTLRRDRLEIEPDAVVYFSGQRGLKRHPDTARLQMQILKEVPKSYFLIKGGANEQSVKHFFIQLAEEEGLERERLRFLPLDKTEASHRANLEIVDVVLDTYPYNGATTTLETLWMGIPLVTRVGEQFAARNSYTMMLNAGIKEGIAWTDEEYVEWGVRLGKDAALRQQISWKLRQSRQTAPLWNAEQFTREMEKAYEQMWRRYLEGTSASRQKFLTTYQ